MKKLLIIITLLAALAGSARAQEETYKFDVGAAWGMSGYIGDANAGNPFRHPGIYGAGSFRYLWNTRMAIRGLLSISSLSGNTADLGSYLPGGEQYSFKSSVTDLSARFEFNFFPYGIGETYKRLKRWTPYIAAGVGMAVASASSKIYFAPSVPMAVGVKFKIKPRLNLGAEFAMTKFFSDHFDSPELSSLTGIKTSFLRNTDWTSSLAVSLSYEFGKRCETCHYVD